MQANARSRPASPEPIRQTPPIAPTVPTVRSEELLSGGHELLIEHRGRHYRLRVTRLGKLILTR